MRFDAWFATSSGQSKPRESSVRIVGAGGPGGSKSPAKPTVGMIAATQPMITAIRVRALILVVVISNLPSKGLLLTNRISCEVSQDTKQPGTDDVLLSMNARRRSIMDDALGGSELFSQSESP